MTRIFAHRGASGYAPENTCEAFALAIEQQADGIELDVNLTKDGEVVVIHDEAIDRVSDGRGMVKDYTLEELRRFSFHNGIEAYRGAGIPTLREVLELVRPAGIQVNIELKTGRIWYPQIEEKTLAIVKETGMEDRVIYSSFNHYSIGKIRRLAPSAETAYLYGDVIVDVGKYAADNGVDGLHPPLAFLKMPDYGREHLRCGRKIRVWTVNSREDMRFCVELGLEGVITNYPDVAVGIRNELQGPLT